MKQVEYQLVKEISDTVTEEMGNTYMIRFCFFFDIVHTISEFCVVALATISHAL